MPGSSRQPFASEAFRGQSRNGAWGDAVEELDWSAGQIFDALKKHNIDERTLVIWTSENGAPRRNPPQGSNAPLGGWGYTTAEGGMRVPAIVRWPNFIPADSVSDELCTLMDLHPTFAKLAGAQLPERKRDGQNIWPVWSPRNAKSPHDHFFYYHTHSLQAVRDHRWKLVLGDTPKLYDLKADMGEQHNLIEQQPAVTKRLRTLANRAKTELGHGEQKGTQVRPVGRSTKPTARIR